MKTKSLFNAIVLAVLSLPLAMSCSQGVEIDGLVWAEENVGISKTTPYGGYYGFNEAQTACPKSWRLPTKYEFELLSRNYSEVEVHNGIAGRWFSGSTPYKKGVKAVFLPMAGRDWGNGPEDIAFGGSYWSSTMIGYYVYDLSVSVSQVSVGGNKLIARSFGYSVRCLKN